MSAAFAIVGVILTVVVAADMIRAMLVPHGARAPIARATAAVVLGAYRSAVRLVPTFRQQDRMLATAAPVALLAQLIVYVTILILTMGLVMRGMSDLDITTSLYQSGSTLTTLGIVAPVTAASAVASFVAAFLGLVAIAVFIGYLLALYSSYTARESQMARMSLLAGEPAWGPVILARVHVLGGSIDNAIDWRTWTNWICDVRTNHAVNPLLSWFRSTSMLRHWTTSTLAVLDAAALRAALDPDSVDPTVIELLAEGSVAAQVLTGVEMARNWDSERAVLSALRAQVVTKQTLADEQWAEGIDCLRGAGIAVDANDDATRARFEALRGLYAERLVSLAHDLHAVPAPWSGPRRPHVAVQRPQLPALDGSPT